MPIFDEQRKYKINDMINNASDVLKYIDNLLPVYQNDESMLVSPSSKP